MDGVLLHGHVENLESESSIVTKQDSRYGAGCLAWWQYLLFAGCGIAGSGNLSKAGEDRLVYLRLFYLSYLSYLFHELFRAFSQVAFLPFGKGEESHSKKSFGQLLIESYVISIWDQFRPEIKAALLPGKSGLVSWRKRAGFPTEIKWLIFPVSFNFISRCFLNRYFDALLLSACGYRTVGMWLQNCKRLHFVEKESGWNLNNIIIKIIKHCIRWVFEIFSLNLQLNLLL